MSVDTMEQRANRGRRTLQDYPNHYANYQKGRYDTVKLKFDELIAKQLLEAKEERPTCLRSNIVEKYVLDILNRQRNPKSYEQKMNIVQDMIKLGVDNRVLN